MRRAGFTLVEIMIVVLIIGILLSIAVPQWVRARESARRTSCLDNLRHFEGAKEQWAMEYHKANGDPVAQADIWPVYLKGTAFPSCNSGGTYTLGPIGTPASCSVHGTY